MVIKVLKQNSKIWFSYFRNSQLGIKIKADIYNLFLISRWQNKPQNYFLHFC